MVVITEIIKLKPDKTQATLIDDYIEDCRHFTNYLINYEIEYYACTGQFLWKNDLFKLIPNYKKRWNSKTPTHILRSSCCRLDLALQRMIKLGSGFPKYKKYGRVRSFGNLDVGFDKKRGADIILDIQNNRIKIPSNDRKFSMYIKTNFRNTLVGHIGTPKICTILRDRTNRYYAYIILEIEDDLFKILPKDRQTKIGIDLGMHNFLVSHDNQYLPAPKFLLKTLKQLRKLQRKFNKAQKGSKNREKLRIKVAKKHKKVVNQRKDYHFKVAHHLVTNYDNIAMEDLKTSTMLRGKKQRKQRRKLGDLGLSLFKVRLTPMANKYNCNLIKVDPAYTSQMCSNCGNIVPKTLNDRIHNCPHCGMIMDRDRNAAYNILKKADLWTALEDLELQNTINFNKVSADLASVHVSNMRLMDVQYN